MRFLSVLEIMDQNIFDIVISSSVCVINSDQFKIVFMTDNRLFLFFLLLCYYSTEYPGITNV